MLAPPSARSDACTWVACAHLTTLRLFSIGSDGGFTEYERSAFETDHEEAVLEEWLASNPDGIVEDGRILIIGRQVRTDLGGFIDLLGVDREGSVVVVELKRDRTPREAVAQALEYAAFAERLDIEALEDVVCRYQNDESLSLADHHREYFGLDEADAVAFNKDQRIVIVGQHVTPARLLERKSAVPTDGLETLWAEADASGVFRRGRHEPANLVCGEGLADVEMMTVLGWFSKLAAAVRAHGLKT